MSIHMAFDPCGGFMRITLTGALSFESFAEAFEALVSHESFRPGASALWDFRAAPLASVPTETLRRIIRFAGARQEMRRGARIGLIAAPDADFGVARI